VSGNTITWVVPVADVGSPKAGDTLYEIQAFTATQTFPNQPSNTDPVFGLYNTGGSTIAPNLIDQAPAFDATLAQPSASGGSSGGGGSQPASAAGSLPNSSAASPALRGAEVAALVAALAAVALGIRARRRRTG
jgi:hypothetical protein